jgi:hypothetical protein
MQLQKIDFKNETCICILKSEDKHDLMANYGNAIITNVSYEMKNHISLHNEQPYKNGKKKNLKFRKSINLHCMFA